MHHRNIHYLWSLTPGIVVVTGNLLGGWWSASNIVYSLGVVALAEMLMPLNASNNHSIKNSFPTVVLYMHVLMQMLALGSFFYAVSIHRFIGFQYGAAVLSLGIHSGSSAIVVAHELIHRKNQVHQLAGKFLLITAGNIYFFVEHLRVHHKWVGTDKDPATARYGESVYKFFWRSTTGQIIHAFHLETKRLEHERKLPWGLSNYVVTSSMLVLLFLCGLYFFLGMKGIILFLAQCMLANFLLEYTNYIEHYGLVRSDNEKVNETHSWQSDKPTSRFFLVDLSRHSDHHCYASKPYHTLDSYPESPVLPAGYITAIYLALVPPLWFRVMHRRINKVMA